MKLEHDDLTDELHMLRHREHATPLNLNEANLRYHKRLEKRKEKM
jgi:hypothetical protein